MLIQSLLNYCLNVLKPYQRQSKLFELLLDAMTLLQCLHWNGFAAVVFTPTFTFVAVVFTPPFTFFYKHFLQWSSLPTFNFVYKHLLQWYPLPLSLFLQWYFTFVDKQSYIFQEDWLCYQISTRSPRFLGHWKFSISFRNFFILATGE